MGVRRKYLLKQQKMKKHNFSAGPSILNHKVINKASKSVLDINNIGLSILEISHRSQDFIEIIEETKKLTKKLLNIPNEYEILFLQGGASLQFYMTALNFLNEDGCAGYINTGTWSTKAIIEAKKAGNIITIASSEDQHFNYIPKKIICDKNIDYVHFTSNNTIYGTQFHDFQNIYDIAEKNNAKLICDMSSDIFSKEIDVSKFDLIYAGAQKNIGPAGATLIIVKKSSVLNNVHLPTYLNYKTHIEKKSMFNTPPVFSIYVAMLTLQWIDEIGGLKKVEENNYNKAKTMYQEIDRNPLFYGIVKTEDRSLMNITFNLKDSNLKIKFESMCEENGVTGIKGHRSVGGYRASLYNALNIESVNLLIDIMQKLEKIA